MDVEALMEKKLSILRYHSLGWRGCGKQEKYKSPSAQQEPGFCADKPGDQGSPVSEKNSSRDSSPERPPPLDLSQTGKLSTGDNKKSPGKLS